MAVIIYFYFLANCQPLVIDIFSHHIESQRLGVFPSISFYYCCTL
nr:hypothetical protein [uncultured Bacteroides sp.]